MANLAIVCANCGAKYRLPETFAKDHAKCTKCGSTIDVASQRGGAAEAAPEKRQPAKAQPAKAKPASARPAKARPARTRGGEAEDAPAASGHRTKGSRLVTHRADGEGGGRRSRRGAGDAEEKGSNKGLIFGGIGVGAVAIVAAVMLMNGGKDDADKDAGKTGEKQVAAADKDGGAAKEADASKGAAKAAEAAADKGEAKPAEGAAAKSEDPKAEDPKAADPKGDEPKTDPAEDKPAADVPKGPLPPGENWRKSQAETIADIYVPKDDLGEITWPDSVSTEEQARLAGLLDDIEGGGRPGISAKTELEEIGYPAVCAIIARLRIIDYTDPDAVFYAYELNKVLDKMTIGVNTGFIPIEFGMDMSTAEAIKTADWNARTVKAWQRLVEKYPDAESFAAMVDARKTRNK